MNHFVGEGKIHRPFEVYYGKKTAVAKGVLGFEVPNSKGIAYLSATRFGKDSVLLSKLAKGEFVRVEGFIYTSSYVNAKKEKVFTTELIVEKFERMGDEEDEHKKDDYPFL